MNNKNKIIALKELILDCKKELSLPFLTVGLNEITHQTLNDAINQLNQLNTKTEKPKMNSSELKYLHELNNPESHFFSPATMRFFGDTMKNYGVKTTGHFIELHRKSPVKNGLYNSAFFTKNDFKIKVNN